MNEPPIWDDAIEQARAVAQGAISPHELLSECINSIESHNPALNAVIHPLFDKAENEVDAGLPAGPFRGVPIVVKDFSATTAGDPYHEGTRFLKAAGWRASEDSNVVRRLRQAGCVIVGRTNLPELASSPTTESDAYGPARNPWDRDRSPGGSSGGSAAAVASGMVAAAHGTDGGGSIRIPASACGLVGLKPSRGRVSCGPAVGESMGGMATDFMLVRSIRDAALFLDVLSVTEIGDPYSAPDSDKSFAKAGLEEPGRLRIGLRTEGLAMTGGGGVAVHPSCLEAVNGAAALLEAMGHLVEPAWPRELDHESVTEAMAILVFVENARALDSWSDRLGRQLGADDVDADNWAMAEAGRTITAASYVASLDHLHGSRLRVGRWFAESYDLLLTPTMADLPPPIGYLAVQPDAPLTASIRSVPFGTFTIPFNLTGQPAISLPLHCADGRLPVGVQMVAAYGNEALLLQVGRALEAAQPWIGRHPAL